MRNEGKGTRKIKYEYEKCPVSIHVHMGDKEQLVAWKWESPCMIELSPL